jgi:hypothetical protein
MSNVLAHVGISNTNPYDIRIIPISMSTVNPPLGVPRPPPQSLPAEVGLRPENN